MIVSATKDNFKSGHLAVSMWHCCLNLKYPTFLWHGCERRERHLLWNITLALAWTRTSHQCMHDVLTIGGKAMSQEKTRHYIFQCQAVKQQVSWSMLNTFDCCGHGPLSGASWASAYFASLRYRVRFILCCQWQKPKNVRWVL